MDPDYEKLKEEIIKATGSGLDIAHIKQELQKAVCEHGEEAIPKRCLQGVLCLKDLFILLEDMDYLNPTNINYLECIATSVRNGKNEVLPLIKTYKKFHDNFSGTCEVCCSHNGTATNIYCSSGGNLFSNCEISQLVSQRFVAPPVPQASNLPPVPQGSSNDIACQLQTRPKELVEAIDALSSRLKVLWPVLLRELGMKEGPIDETRKKFRNDFEKQAKRALEYWSIADHEASLEKLHAALSSSECARRGLSPGLTKSDPYLKYLLG